MAGDGDSRLAVAAPLPVLLAPGGDQGPARGASTPKEQPSPTGVMSDWRVWNVEEKMEKKVLALT